MKNKWSNPKVKSVQKWLACRWPDLFREGPNRLPLSLDIHKEILKYRDENPELSSRTLSEALKRHTTSFGYLYGLCKNSHRYNLDGSRETLISMEHKIRARWKLKQLRKKLQSDRRSRLTITKSNSTAEKPTIIVKRRRVSSSYVVAKNSSRYLHDKTLFN